MSQNINLYDPSLRIRRDWLGFHPALAFVGVASLCVSLGSAAARWSLAQVEPRAAQGAAELEAQQAAAQALAVRIAARKPDAELQAKIAAAQRALMQRRAALAGLDRGAIDRDDGFSRRLEALARQSVEGLWLTSMSLRIDDVLLKGRAMTPSLIPAYVQRLDRETSLQGRAFKALDVRRPLDGTSTPAALPATTTAADEPAAPPRHAEYVEFTLVGAAHVDANADDKAGPAAASATAGTLSAR